VRVNDHAVDWQAVTRMNYGLNHARDLTVRPINLGDRKRLAGKRSKKRKTGFSSKYGGNCANCHAFMPVGTFVKFNAFKNVVHAEGCPRKVI